MDMLSHLSTAYSKLFMPSGRACRAEFWTIYAANLVILLICLQLAMQASGTASIVFSVIGIAAVTLGNLTAAARRLHDTNRTGWWIASTILPFMAFVVIFFLMQRGVSGPTRFDAHADPYTHPPQDLRPA
ncbi:DUF805 domain-containing protein [uncultured Litoreibacter sp.]|uniref:DUF805 domain-containing protein n=1 Tax=uncultured Litoreibacter sp. TaxID=1392394 RepID=UPI00260B7B57|nr:DUF805 domain-containing protein [uncultured Litoreibacter sp.]